MLSIQPLLRHEFFKGLLLKGSPVLKALFISFKMPQLKPY